MADPEIEQLKALVRQNIALSQETNRMLRGMRATGRLKSFFWLLFLAASIGVSVYLYYAFVEPRVKQVESIYHANVAPFQSALNFFKNGSSTSTPAQ